MLNLPLNPENPSSAPGSEESEVMPSLEEQASGYEQDNTESMQKHSNRTHISMVSREIEDVQLFEISSPQVISGVAIPVNHPQVLEWKKLTKNAKGTIQLKKGDTHS